MVHNFAGQLCLGKPGRLAVTSWWLCEVIWRVFWNCSLATNLWILKLFSLSFGSWLFWDYWDSESAGQDSAPTSGMLSVQSLFGHFVTGVNVLWADRVGHLQTVLGWLIQRGPKFRRAMFMLVWLTVRCLPVRFHHFLGLIQCRNASLSVRLNLCSRYGTFLSENPVFVLTLSNRLPLFRDLHLFRKIISK